MILYVYTSLVTSFVHSLRRSFVMSNSVVVAPESVSVHLERNPVPATQSVYWPLTHEAVDACDLSFLKDSWSEDMIKDAMHSIVIVGQLPDIKTKEINVWKYLSQYSPPEDRGFMFSYGDDKIVTLVGDHMTVGHSGASMGWTMRQIEFIAKNGIPTYRNMFLRRNK